MIVPCRLSAFDPVGNLTGGSGADPILLNDAGSDGTTMYVTVDSGSAITFDTSEHLYSLTIDSGATATMADNGQSVLVTNTLSIAGSTDAWTGTLDLSDNGLIVHDGNLATITNQIKSGRSGNWTGTGIDSSSAASSTTHLQSLGAIPNQNSESTAIYTTFDAQAVSTSDILVQYTYYGDNDLNGNVDGNDYSLIDYSYENHLTGWLNGDYNYDGTVDGSDYTLIDNAFNSQGAAIIDGGAGVSPASLPSGWSKTDIDLTQGGKTPNTSGSASYDFGSGTGSVSTADIAGDKLLSFTGQDLFGNGSVSAEITNVQASSSQSLDAVAGGGVLIVDQPNSSFVSLMLGSDGQLRFGIGNLDNWSDAYEQISTSAITGPVWLDLQHSGNSFNAYYSTDDINWIQVESDAGGITMSQDVVAGLATSNDLNSVGSTDQTTLGSANTSFADVNIIAVAPTSTHSANISFFAPWIGSTPSVVQIANASVGSYSNVGDVAAGQSSYQIYNLDPSINYTVEVNAASGSGTLPAVAGTAPIVNTNVAQYTFSIDSSQLNSGNYETGSSPWVATTATIQRTSVWADNEHDAAEDAGVQIGFQYLGEPESDGGLPFAPTPTLTTAGLLSLPTDSSSETVASYRGIPSDELVLAWNPATTSGSGPLPDISQALLGFGFGFGGYVDFPEDTTGNDCGCAPQPSETSAQPVYYSDGVAQEEATDLQSNGFGINWGVTRNWTNTAQSTVASNIFGNNIDEEQLSRLVFDGNSVGVATDGASIFWFDPGPNANVFIPRFGSGQTLTLVSDYGVYMYDWSDANGDVTQFYADGTDTGQFASYTDAGGDVALTNYSYTGQLNSIVIQTPGQPGFEQYFYSYSDSQVSQVQLQQSNGSVLTPVQTVEYTYYSSGSSYGNAGDLEFATLYDGNGTGANSQSINTDYYRYYTPIPITAGSVTTTYSDKSVTPVGNDMPLDEYVIANHETLYFSTEGLNLGNGDLTDVSVSFGGNNVNGDSGKYAVNISASGDVGTISLTTYGYGPKEDSDGSHSINTDGMTVLINGNQGDLEYTFEGRSFAQLQAADSGFSSSSDSVVAPYASNYFQYDSENRVVLEKPQGAGASGAPTQGTAYIGYKYSENLYEVDDSTTTIQPNVWTTQTIETTYNSNWQQVGPQQIVYTNAFSQVLLDDTYYSTDGGASGTLNSAIGYEYSDTTANIGNLIATVYQSALSPNVQWSNWGLDAGINAEPVLDNLSGDGLIDTITYGETTTASATTAGNVAGYEESTGVQNGNETPIEQESFTYYSHSDVVGNVIYLMAADTVYTGNSANGDGDAAGAETTNYSYPAFYGDTNAVKEMDTTLPLTGAAENGPTTRDTEKTIYDQQGRVIWTQDGDGYINYTAYNNATGAVVEQIEDDSNSPVGWTTVAGTHLNLTTYYGVDTQGRIIEETSPQGNVTYTAYNDSNHQVSVFAGWNTSTNMPTGPTQVYTQNWALGYDEMLTTSAAPQLSSGVPVGPGDIESSNIQSLIRDVLDLGGQTIAEDDYFTLSGVTYSTGSVILGSAGIQYYATTYQYNADGLLFETTDPNGTMTQTVYDGINRPISTLVGTSDGTGTTASNLVDVEDDYYDGNTPGDANDQTPGDGNLTEVVHNPADGQAEQITAYFYDWQDREVGELDGSENADDPDTGGAGAILYVTQYDDQDEPVVSTQFAAGGLTLYPNNFAGTFVNPGAGQPLPDGLTDNIDGYDLRAMSESSYDDQGRVYQTNVFSVQPLSSGDAGQVGATPITTNIYYDHRGDVMATENPTGLWTKSFYDGADRLIEQDQTNGAGGSTWAAAGPISGDVVFSQTLYKYDGDDNLIETVEKDRLNGDSASATGALSGSGSTASRVSYTASYYDATDRDIADVNVGTNSNSSWSRPTSVPARSSSVLVTSYAYDAAGNLAFVTDPNDLITAYGYDLLGRTTVTVANWTNTLVGPVSAGTLPAPTDSTNQTTEYTYDGDNNITSVTAGVPAGEGEQNQTTDYIYGVNTTQGSLIDDNDLLYQVQYPDPTTGDASSAQAETYTYDALGDQLTYTDRNGTTHAYTYDSQGRLTADQVTAFGAGVDQTVAEIGYTYDDAGNMSAATSYNASGGVVNQVAETYDGFGQLASDAQSHNGTVSGSTPTVGYTYDPTNGDRLSSMTYPNGRTLSYNYNSGLDSDASRISFISDENGLIQSYQYQGLDTPMVATSGNGVVGTTVLDSFGRVSSLTYAMGGNTIDGYSYTYDADGNVASKTNLKFSGLSETYGYDGLNRLTSFARGTISGGTIAAPSTSESWDLDALGNQKSVTVNGTPVTRATNSQNQIESLSNSTTDLNYDADGNTLNDQNGQTYKYDAWNRLVSVTTPGGDTISYTYDALNRRITGTDSVSGVTTDFYYSSSGQIIEERQGSTVTAQFVWGVFYVNQLIQETNASGTFYVQQDANYNITSISNSSGSVVERYIYDPYGAVTVLNAGGTVLGTGLSFSTVGQQFGFQGGWTDSKTNLENFNARWLTLNGTWLTEDPTGAAYVNGLDLGQLEESNPVGSIDPTGQGGIFISGGHWHPIPPPPALVNAVHSAPDVAVSLIPDAIPVGVGLWYWATSEGGDETEFDIAIKEAEEDAADAEQRAVNAAAQPHSTPSTTPKSQPSAQAPVTPASPATPQAQPEAEPATPAPSNGDNGSCPTKSAQHADPEESPPRQPGGDEESQQQQDQGTGNYRNTHQSGKTYSGKGGTDRMGDSARRIANQNNDPVVSQTHTTAPDDKQSLIQEQNDIEAAGGPGGNTYNKINSHGKKLRDGK